MRKRLNDMQKIIFILLAILTLKTYSQSNDTTYSGKFDLGFSFSPDYSYRVLTSGTENNWMKDSYDTLEVARYAYTTGFSFAYHPDEKFSISVGVLFSDKGEKTKRYTIPPVNNYINHYYYLDLPVKASYYVYSGKIKLYVSVGICTNIYLRGLTHIEVPASAETKKVEMAPGMNAISASFIGGLGIDCPLSNRWYFKLEPNYRRFITPATNSGVKRYFYSGGLNAGFFFQL